MGPTWGPSGADRSQLDTMLAPWTLLSGFLKTWEANLHSRPIREINLRSFSVIWYTYRSLEITQYHMINASQWYVLPMHLHCKIFSSITPSIDAQHSNWSICMWSFVYKHVNRYLQRNRYIATSVVVSNVTESLLMWQNGEPLPEWRTWASYQIRKIADCACAGNAGKVFPATDLKGNR